MRGTAIAAVMLLALLSCKQGLSSRISDSIHELACSGQKRLVLADAASFDWDEIIILTPYAGSRDAERALGRPWKDYAEYENALNSEGADILIFLKRNKIVLTVEHRRILGDFSDDLLGKRFDRRKAIFRVERPLSRCDFPKIEPLP